MRRTTAFFFAALVLIGLGFGTAQRFLGGSGGTVLNGTGQPETAAAPAHTKSIKPSSDRPSAHPANDATADRSSELLSSEVRQSAGSRVPSKQIHVSESQDPSAVETEESSAGDVIGRPFPLSTSVEKSCKRWSENGATEMCSEAQETLAQMAQEPRDSAWASKMEAALRDHVMTEEPGKFSVRAIECRTSVCAVEVESIYGPYLGGIYPDHPVSKSLRTWLPIRGYETNEYGAKVTVTLMTFKRR